MRKTVPLHLFAVLAAAGCAPESGPADIEAALRDCGIEGAKIAKREDDGSQSPYEVDLGVTASGAEDSACMNGLLRNLGLRPVLTFYQAP